MRRRLAAAFTGLALAWVAPARAQVPDWVSQILTAAELPVATAEARREGVKSDDIRGVLDVLMKSRVPAHEATAVIDTARAVRREHGPVDNFGAFVQSQLAAGKRGRELAAAIRAEHARQGRGNAGRPGASQDRGRSDSARDSARGRGRSDARPGAPGRKPEDRGRGKQP